MKRFPKLPEIDPETYQYLQTYDLVNQVFVIIIMGWDCTRNM